MSLYALTKMQNMTGKLHNLSEIVPLAACPHSPDNVKPVSELKNIKVDQCCIGSCTNSSYDDLMKAAAILKGQTVSDNVSYHISGIQAGV